MSSFLVSFGIFVVILSPENSHVAYFVYTGYRTFLTISVIQVMCVKINIMGR